MSVWASITSPPPRCTRVGVISLDRRAGAHVDPAPLEGLAGVALRGGAERRQQLVAHLEQVHPGPVHVEVAEVLAQHLGEQLDQRAGHLDAGGAAADDHEVQGAVVDERRVGVGRLEPAEHVVAEADRVAQAVEREAVGVGARRRRTCWSTPRPPRRGGRTAGSSPPSSETSWRSQSTPVTVALAERAGSPGAGRCRGSGRRRRPRSGPPWPPGRAAAGTCGSCSGRSSVTSTGIAGQLLRRRHPAEPAADDDDSVSVPRAEVRALRRCGVRQAEQRRVTEPIGEAGPSSERREARGQMWLGSMHAVSRPKTRLRRPKPSQHPRHMLSSTSSRSS